MYKPRGKPHEAKNVVLAQQHMALAETIMISPITKTPSFRSYTSKSKVVPTIKHSAHYHTGNPTEMELRQQRQHFEAFREAYQERVGGRRVVYEKRQVVQSPTLGTESFEPEPMMKDFLSRYGIRKLSDIRKPVPPTLPPLRQKPTPKRPVLIRNTIRTVKPQYPLQKLEFGADFPEEPPKPILKKKSKENAAMAAINELKEIERDLIESESNEKLNKDSKTKICSPEDREELFKQLQATENQISVATSQLQAIQKILQDNRMLTTVHEEEESDDKEKSCQTEDAKPKMPSIKWKVKTTLRGSQNKRTRLVDTLNLLNNRLQNMQDKYFNAPRVKYKTFEEVLANKNKQKNRKGIETIYQNMRYDYDSAAELDLQPTISSELKQLLDKTNINAIRGKSEPKTNTYAVQANEESCDNISRDRSINTTTMSTSKVAVNESKNSREDTLTGISNLTNGTITSTNVFTNSSSKFDIKNLKSSAQLLSEINCTDIIFAPRKNSSGDGLKYNNIVFDEDYIPEDEDDDEEATVNNSGLEKAIEKSIKASNYLTREFDTLRGDYGMKLDNVLQMKAKNVRFGEPQEIVDRVEQVCSPAADRIKHLFCKFDNILKDSLYSTDT